MNNLLKKYNSSEATLVVSSYPDKKNGIKNLNAVAWHTQKNLKNINRKFVIFAEITTKPEIYEDGNLLIVRCWKPNSINLFFLLLWQLQRFNKAKNVLIEFEFNTFGGMIGSMFFPLFLILLRLKQKRVILEIHQVLLDINTLSGHLNLENKKLLTFFFNFLLVIFYKFIGLLSNEIIVLEEELKNRLARIVDEKKITTFFIAISSKKEISKEKARKILGIKKDEFVLLNFGFINWYKGSDWLVNKCSNKNNYRLIMAGGQSPTLKNKAHYQKFYRKVLTSSKKSNNIEITGFIKDERIPLYFSACDLVVLPYRTFMSSSGPLSWAFSFGKPFLISQNLKSYFQSKNFINAGELIGVGQKDITFSLNGSSFEQKLENLDLEKMSNFSKSICQMRTQENLSRMYIDLFDNDANYYSLNNSFSHLWAKLRASYLAFWLG